MTQRDNATAAKTVAQGVGLLNVMMFLVAFSLLLIFSSQLAALEFTAEEWLWVTVGSSGALVYSVFAVLILSRHPRHTVGWLLLSAGFSSALFGLTGALTTMSMGLPIRSEAVREWIAWSSSWPWVPTFLIPLTLVLQFFPDGRLPSRRWWPITVATVMLIGLHMAKSALLPWPVENYGAANPLAIPGGEAFFASIAILEFLVTALATVGSVAAVFVRFHGSAGVERQQMKWLLYTASIGIGLQLLSTALLQADSLILTALFVLTPIALMTAIGIAILRYRLFDIDIIVRRTLQYTILTGLLVLVYFGLIILIQSLFSEFGEQSGIFTVLSTLAVAALFSPLRRRVQAFIDHRFYRRKYDAEQALARFAATTRDEVDMDELTTALLRVVEQTIQPEHLSLWLAPGSGRRGDR